MTTDFGWAVNARSASHGHFSIPCVWMVAPWVPLRAAFTDRPWFSVQSMPARPAVSRVRREATEDVPFAHSRIHPVLVHFGGLLFSFSFFPLFFCQSALFACNDHQRRTDGSVWFHDFGEMLNWRLLACPLYQLIPSCCHLTSRSIAAWQDSQGKNKQTKQEKRAREKHAINKCQVASGWFGWREGKSSSWRRRIMQWVPHVTINRYVIFCNVFLWKRCCWLTRQLLWPSSTCVCVWDMHSHILWQVGRGGGQRRAMTLRCLLSEYHSVVLMRALDAWLTLVIGVISPRLQCRSRAMRRDVQKKYSPVNNDLINCGGLFVAWEVST